LYGRYKKGLFAHFQHTSVDEPADFNTSYPPWHNLTPFMNLGGLKFLGNLFSGSSSNFCNDSFKKLEEKS
jgi:hypothetical protein